MGQKVRIRVKDAAPANRTIDFVLSGAPDSIERKIGRDRSGIFRCGVEKGEEKMAKEKGSRLIANNKKAYHDYFIEDKYEAGIALAGTEVKSLRMGKCSIKESFLRIENGE